MAEPAESSDLAELVERLEQLAADERSSDVEQRPAERLAFDLVRQRHDRINELYYEHGLSDAEAEARTLEEAGLSPAGIALTMTATGRSDLSERTVTEYLE